MLYKDSLILVVDDMKMMRKLIQKELKKIGFHNTIEAEDGTEAWKKMESSEAVVDLIISDWNMPTSKGIDLLRKIKASNKFRNTPFILLTSVRGGEQIQEAIQAGVDHYIMKPFDHKTFKSKVLQVYDKYKTSRAKTV